MNKESFLYQINFNKKKFPEIVAALEKAKDDNGVAWYLRELIQRDIQERKFGAVKAAPDFQEINEDPEPPKKVQKQEPVKQETIELPEESGGFM